LFVKRKKIIVGSNGTKIEDNCCYYNMESQNCESETTNFMIVYYGKNNEYSDGKGFAQGFREGIKFIINNDHNLKITDTEKLNIKAGNRIEVYFSSITNLQNFFFNDKDPNSENVISLDLSHLDVSLVKNFNSMFSGCNSLKSIDLTNFNTSSAINMSSMFQGCNSLISIDMANFNTSSVEDMGSMFLSCYNLQYLDLSIFDTSKVTQLSSIFAECISLKVLDISSFNMENIQKCDNMFKDVNLRYLNLYNTKNFKVDDQLN